MVGIFPIKKLEYFQRNRNGVDIIWCLLHCPQGQLEEMILTCKEKLSKEALADAFIPTFDRMKRYQGAWHVEQMPLFPKDIILEAGDPGLLSRELKENHVTAYQFLDQEGEAVFRSLWDADHHLVMSVGCIENGHTYVTEGPLRGKEHYIRKIDRHKRLAKLEVSLGTSVKEIYAGLEIIRKYET